MSVGFNNQKPDLIHNYDCLNGYKDPYLLWVKRRGYGRHIKTSKEQKQFFDRKRKDHERLEYSILLDGMEREFTLEGVVHDISFMGNVDVFFDNNHCVHLFELKSYFHIPNRPLPYHSNLVQTIQYGSFADLSKYKNIYLHVVYLNKGFEFKFTNRFNLLTVENLITARNTIEGEFAPIRCPLNGQCQKCYLPKEYCENKRRFYRDRWSILGS